jgi:hypothetical protein
MNHRPRRWSFRYLLVSAFGLAVLLSVAAHACDKASGLNLRLNSVIQTAWAASAEKLAGQGISFKGWFAPARLPPARRDAVYSLERGFAAPALVRRDEPSLNLRLGFGWPASPAEPAAAFEPPRMSSHPTSDGADPQVFITVGTDW